MALPSTMTSAYRPLAEDMLLLDVAKKDSTGAFKRPASPPRLPYPHKPTLKARTSQSKISCQPVQKVRKRHFSPI